MAAAEYPLVRLAAAGTLNARTERYQKTLELRADATAFAGGDYGFGGHRFKGEEPRKAAMAALANAVADDAAALRKLLPVQARDALLQKAAAEVQPSLRQLAVLALWVNGA